MILEIVNQIIEDADKALDGIDEELVLDFVDIFPVSKEERKELTSEIQNIGKEISRTETGEIYLLNEPIKTKFGQPRLVKIRIYDENKKQRGAPDFKVDYEQFKKKYLGRESFHFIERPDYEMIELSSDNVLIYFPNETLSESLDIK